MKKLSFIALAVVAMMAVSCNDKAKDTQTDGKEATETEQAEETDATSGATETSQASDNSGAVISLADDAKFTKDSKVDKVTVLDFNAVWCGPCKRLTPAFHQVAEEMKDVDFYTVDVDSLPKTAEAFDIKSIPVVVILAPGKEPKIYESLTPFVDGDNADTEVIAGNLKKYIQEASK